MNSDKIEREPLKVLYIIGQGGLGGIERHVQSLALCIREYNIIPHICVIRQNGCIAEALKCDKIPVYVLEAKSGHDLKLIGKFLKTIRQASPHIVHFHELPFIPALLMYFFIKISVVYSQHCPIGEVVPVSKTKLSWLILKNRINHILAVSIATKKRMKECLDVSEQCVSVIYNGIICNQIIKKNNRRILESPEHVKKIGGIGRLVTGKGWHSFLETAKYIIDMRNDVEFVIIGDGPLKIELEKKAESLEIHKNVRFMGFRDDAVDILSEFDIFLFTSQYEQLPTTLLEAFAAQIPVAGFIPRGGTIEIINLCQSYPGIFLEKRSPEELARAVHNLLNDPIKIQEIVTEGYRVVCRYFDMQKISMEIMSIYKKLIKNK